MSDFFDEVNISEAITWNGMDLDKIVPGYHTLKVKGREDSSRTVTSQDRPGDGKIFNYSFYDDKEIVVTFIMQAKTPVEFMQRWDVLRQTLVADNYSEVRFSFADEPGTYRLGTLKSLSNPNDGKLNVVGTMTIELTQPFKYFNPKTITIKDGDKLYDTNLSYPVVPDKIVLKKATKPFFKVNGTKANISFNAAYDGSMDIVIDLQAMTVKRQTSNVMDGLGLNTTLGSFKIKNGNAFTVLGCEAVELTYKAVII